MVLYQKSKKMTRIKDYSLDTTLSNLDKLIGTDSIDNSTKAFSVVSLVSHVNTSPTAVTGKSGTTVSIAAGTSRIVFLTEALVSGDITVNLHDATDLDGSIYSFVAKNGNNFILTPLAPNLIDGASSKTVSSGSITVVSSGADWYTVA